MTEREKRSTGILQEYDEIRKLILDHPELPLIFTGWNRDGIKAEIGEVLDCQQEINDKIVFSDREDFEEEIDQNIYSLTPYWKPCILILVGN